MRPVFRKLLSAALAAAMLAAPLRVYASDALGHDLAAKETELNAGVALLGDTFWSDSKSDLRRENYVVYTPNERVKPVIAYGETSRSLMTTASAAAELEAQGWRVVAGVNGDYYDTSNGLPIGSTMVDGLLRNLSGDAYYAVGFRADGTALIGDPQLSIRAAVNGGEGFPVFALNYIRHSEFGISLYDHNFNTRHTTGTSESGVDVICSVEDGALTIGGTLALRVDEVLPEATDTVVPEGKYVLTANLNAGEVSTAPLLALQPNDQIVLSVASAAGEAWNDVVSLIGAPELLVENGAVHPGLPTGSAPRTAIGQRADGSIVLYTIDGRQSGYSIGATLEMVALRLIELGCVTAVALDGGGSTTLVATMPNETSARIVNSPSEASARAVSNHVFLVAPNTPSGEPGRVYLSPATVRALPGATVSLTAAAIDTNHIPTSAPVTLSADGGTLSGSALTLPAEPGTVVVTASCGSLSASASVEVMEPERIVVTSNGSAVSALTLAPDSDARLAAKGIVNHLALAGDSACFTWSFEGSGLTFLPDSHTLRASGGAGAGTLTVSIGSRSVSLPVTVAAVPNKLLADFEGAFEPVSDNAEAPALTLSYASDAEHVMRGKGGAKLSYAFGEGGSAAIPVDYAVPAGYDCVKLWVCGDGGTALLALETDAGPSDASELSFTGWAPVCLTLPAGATTVTGISLSAAESAEGAVWLDQLILSAGSAFDETAPEVELTLDEETNSLAGLAFDAVDGAALPTLRLTFDGEAMEYARDARTGAMSAALPASDGLVHRVTLIAGDASGNLARASVDIPAAAGNAPAFPDVEGHWAAASVEYLKRAGITNGNGGLYLPDANITRQEFAVMLYRYLAPIEDFSGVELPFADRDRIGGWALDAAKAMYALGVVAGVGGADGKLRYEPQANISRQEAATMLGRLLEKGYAAPETSYADNGDIPAWAAQHVRVLSAFGMFADFAPDAFEPSLPLTRAEMASMLYRIN